MPRPFSLRVFMPQGEPQGLRVVEKTNWTGLGVVFPRNRLDKARERPELARTGVYVLWNDDDQIRPTVYVGQSENVARRIREHADNELMDWWTRTAAFTTKDDAFNQAHARFLEWALIRRAREGNRCEVQNRVQPSKPSVSESDEADAEHFLEDLLQCLPLAGLVAFESVVSVGGAEDAQDGGLLLHLERPGIGVHATAVPGVAEFTVLKGATIRRDQDLPPGFVKEHSGYRTLRRKLIDQGVIADMGGDHYVLQRDWTFSSPSQANVVIAGLPMQPYQVWKDSSGRTWREILDAVEQESP